MGLVISESLGVTVAFIEDTSLLDPVAIESIRARLVQLVDEEDRRKLVVDFRRVQHLSSQMIGAVIELHKKSVAIKGKLVLCGMRDPVREGFKITKLDKLLTIVGDEKDAVGKLTGL